MPGRPLTVVAVSGSLHSPSKTTALLRAITDELAAAREIDVSLVEVEQFAGAPNRGALPAAAAANLELVETADLVVVASPVYRASYTGLFKHLFDLVGQDALAGTPVLLAATGGNDLHSLVIEHQLRPLFGFFRALTLPVGVYAKDSEFADYRVESDELRSRIRLAVESALPLLPGA